MHFPEKCRLAYFYSDEFTIYQFFFTDMCYNTREPVRRAHHRAKGAILQSKKVHTAVMLYE